MAVGTDIGLTLKLTTKPNLFTIDESNQKFWNRLVLHDSIAMFTPYADMIVPDIGGLFNERHFFTEGMVINLRMGVNSTRFGYISHDFTWNEYQMNPESTREGSHPTGDATFVLESRFADEDYEKSRSFGNVKISKAVDTAMRSYNLTPVQPVHGSQTQGRLIIVDTSNTMVCTQPDEYDIDFVQRMAQSAFNSTYNNTGYVAFWNLRNEFIFAPVGYLLKQKPVATLTMTQQPTTLEEPNTIKNYGLYFGGADVNRENYRQHVWVLGEDGSLSSKAVSLQNHVFKANPRDRTTIARSRLTNLKTTNWYGVASKKDADALKAYHNHINVESNLAFRFEAMVPFHPDLVTGRTVQLEIGSAFQNLQIAPEYSGVWLIVGSDHFYDKDGYGASRLTLGRGTLNIRKEHPYFGTFV